MLSKPPPYPFPHVMRRDYDHKRDEQVLHDDLPRLRFLLFCKVETYDTEKRQPPDYADYDGCRELEQQDGDNERHRKDELGKKSGER